MLQPGRTGDCGKYVGEHCEARRVYQQVKVEVEKLLSWREEQKPEGWKRVHGLSMSFQSGAALDEATSRCDCLGW